MHPDATSSRRSLEGHHHPAGWFTSALHSPRLLAPPVARADRLEDVDSMPSWHSGTSPSKRRNAWMAQAGNAMN